jgi:hypothetical protein
MTFEQRLENKSRRTLLGVGVSAIAILSVLGLVMWGVGFAVNPLIQAGRVVQKTIDADNMIGNYEWFKRQYQDVIAIDQKVAAADATKSAFEQSAGDRASWRFEDRQEWNRLNAALLGLRNQRASMVAEYNARTQMANRDLFRTSDLPAVIE